MKDEIELLRDRLESVSNQLAEELIAGQRKTAEIVKLKAAHEQIGIGGNHLASALIGWLGAGEGTFPPYTCDINEAREIMDDNGHVDCWDAWVCWKTIMQARDMLETK